MAPAVLGLMVAVLATPAWAGVDQCLNYSDNRSVAACVERQGGPVPVRRTGPTPTVTKTDAKPTPAKAEFEGRSVRVTPVERKAPAAPPAPPMSAMESTVRSMNWWYLVIPGVAVLLIVLQLAGRAVYGQGSAYVPVGARRPGAAAAPSGGLGGLFGRLAKSYRRCPYCGAGAARGARVCKQCLRALPA